MTPATSNSLAISNLTSNTLGHISKYLRVTNTICNSSSINNSRCYSKTDRDQISRNLLSLNKLTNNQELQFKTSKNKPKVMKHQLRTLYSRLKRLQSNSHLCISRKNKRKKSNRKNQKRVKAMNIE